MLIVHGLTGGSHTNYVRHYTRALDLSGIRPVVMNARGCNDSVLKVCPMSRAVFVCSLSDIYLF